MPEFGVTARSAQQAGISDKQHRRRVHRRWRAFLRFTCAVLIVVVLSSILFKANLSILFFILLPVFVTIVWSPLQLSRLIHGTLRYNVLIICLEILYFACITAIEFFIHTPGFGLLYLYHGPSIPMIIIVTTTLAWVVILAPLHNLGQTFIERRYNRRNFAATRAIVAFTSTLREEIDLDRVRNGLLDVVQHTMQPTTIALWVRTVRRNDMEHPAASAEFNASIADNDPLLTFALSHSGAIEVEKLQLASPALQSLRTNRVELALPLASQGELIGLLTLGPRLDGEAYDRENKELLNTLIAQAAPALRVAQLVQEQERQVREQAAREEAARLAVMTERLRIARDLHDLLGHNLSLITLKSELARRLAGNNSERLAAEIQDIEMVARTTLQEVREAVSNYRQPALLNELHGAQEMLAAAGIAFHYEDNNDTGDLGTLPTPIEAALAWAIREGVTNIIRHSRAHSCTIRVSRTKENAHVEITDDGTGAIKEVAAGQPADTSSAHGNNRHGNGLRGLAERISALDGQFEAGSFNGDGFCLAISLPLTQKAGATN